MASLDHRSGGLWGDAALGAPGIRSDPDAASRWRGNPVTAHRAKDRW